ncbi:MAG TPA: DHH family phosphoesterase [bacterium]|nr:DHH family phosphoesterase [bacterium]
MKKSRSDLATLLKTTQSALIVGHITPDGDSVGSSVALYHLFTGFGISTTLYSADPYPYNFMFIPGAEKVVYELPLIEPDFYVVVDAGSPQRTGEAIYQQMSVSRKPKIFFDHHVSYRDPGAFFDQVFLDDAAAATALLVHRFMKQHGYPMTREIAIAIYAAVMADTGGMRYNSTNREAFAVLSELVDFVEPWEIAAKIWEEVPHAQMRLLAEVIASIRLLAGGKAAVFEITRAQLDRYRLGPDHVDSFINYARAIAGVEVAMRFRELAPYRYKVSMRSKGNIDAAKISNEFGGGGHRNAAGFEFSGTFDEGCKLVEEIVARVAVR